MANEIVGQALGTSLDGYFQIWNTAGLVYNGTTFESYNDSDWATQYARSQSATSAAGDYRGTFPLLSAGYYFVKIYVCLNGGTPATTDSLAGTDEFYWTGTQRTDRLAAASGSVDVSSIANGAITAATFASGAFDDAAQDIITALFAADATGVATTDTYLDSLQRTLGIIARVAQLTLSDAFVSFANNTLTVVLPAFEGYDQTTVTQPYDANGRPSGTRNVTAPVEL